MSCILTLVITAQNLFSSPVNFTIRAFDEKNPGDSAMLAAISVPRHDSTKDYSSGTVNYLVELNAFLQNPVNRKYLKRAKLKLYFSLALLRALPSDGSLVISKVEQRFEPAGQSN